MSILGNGEDSGTPTSSSENESISPVASPTWVPPRWTEGTTLPPPDGASSSGSGSEESERRPSKWDVEAPLVIPHRTLKLRRLLFDAFHSALTILHETKPHSVVSGGAGPQGRPKRKGEAETVRLDVREPWMRLSRTVGALKGSVGGLKEDDGVSRLSAVVLQIVMNHFVLSRSTEKQYVRTLARNEAKAIPSLTKSWSKVPHVVAQGRDTHRQEQEDSEDALLAALQSTPIVILRLAHYALLGTARDGVDLSGLGLPPSILDGLDIPVLCSMFGIVREEVTKLDVSMNGWRRLPAWLPFPFPAVTSLDLTNNSPLTHTPISLLRTSISKMHVRGTQLAEPSGLSLIRSIHTTRNTEQSSNTAKVLGSTMSGSVKSDGVPSLSHTLLRLYAKILRPHYPPSTLGDLPPHILHLLSETYTCELCLQYQYPDQSNWLEQEVERGWLVVEAERKVVRVKGRVCKMCEIRHLRPVIDLDR